MNLRFDRAKLNRICEKNHINYLGLFGSFARGEEALGSDVDLLIDFDGTKSLFELTRVQSSFEEILNKNVDLVIRKNLKPRIKPYVYRDLHTIYEKR